MTNEELAAIAQQRQHIERCRDDLEAAAVAFVDLYEDGNVYYRTWMPDFDRLVAAALAMREARKGTE